MTGLFSARAPERLLDGAPPPANLPSSRTDNPYWDIVRALPGDGIDWEFERVWSPKWGLGVDRHELCREFSWAIPDPDSLDFVASYLAGGCVEIGAGTGYWAWQLAQLGVDIVAYDILPPQQSGENYFHSPRVARYGDLLGALRSVFFDVRKGSHHAAADHLERALFLCWPPYNDSMAADCLTCYLGNRLVFIGESEGGCTGGETFFAKLGRDWHEVASHRPVQWWGIHDWITVYERNAEGESEGV